MSKIYQKTLPAGKNAGFTLIELLVVVLIIGILAAVALPQYQKAVEKSRAAQSLAVLKSFGQAYQAYYMANGDYPSTFDQLDLDMSAWTGNEKWYSNATDTRSNGEWALQIISGDQYEGLYVGRLNGEYKGGGFGIFFVSPAGPDKDTIICLERIHTGVAYQRQMHSYCEQMFQATLIQPIGGVRAYRMP